jgi:predicted RNase H-like HicB family nuclease
MKTTKKKADENVRDYQPGDKVLRAARKALATYTLVIEPDSQLSYIGWAKELSTVFAGGPTPEDCVATLKFSLESALSAMLEEGLELPRPISEAKRTQQVNIRLTPYEKQLLMRESAKRGFRGVSDLIRAQTIDKLLAS